MEYSSSHDSTITLPSTPVPGDIDLGVAIEPGQVVRANQCPASPLNADDSEPDVEILQSSSASLPVTDDFVRSSEATREIIISPSGRQRFVLVLEDRQIITCVVNYLRSISDSFARSQTNSWWKYQKLTNIWRNS